MESLSDVTVEEFEAALTPERLRPLQMIQAACGFGVVAFGAILGVLLTQQSATAQPGNMQVIQILSVLNAAWFVGSHMTASVLYGLFFSPARLARAAQGEMRGPDGQGLHSPAEKCIVLIWIATILRLAVLESSAVIGFVACLFAIQFGVIRDHPEYWANFATCVLFLGYAAFTVPSRERLRDVFLTRIADTPAGGNT